MQCPDCQRENEPTYRFCIFCGSPLQAGETQELSEKMRKQAVADANLEVATNYAAFQRRFMAWIIDAIILGVLFPVIFLIIYYISYETSAGRYLDFEPLGAGIFCWLCFGIIYFIGFWTWRGQTPGKMILKIKIVKGDGNPIDIVRAILRYIGYLVSTVIAFIGHFMIIWDRRKQGLHDKIARTYVVNTYQVKTPQSVNNNTKIRDL